VSSFEKSVYEFLVEQVTDLSDDENALFDPSSPLYQAEVLKDEYEEQKKDIGIRIGKCVGRVAPNSGQTRIKQEDAPLTLIFYKRISRGDKQARSSYRDDVVMMAEAAALLFFNDPTIGGRVELVRPLTIPRGMDDTDASPYAIANLTLVVNETGAINFDAWRQQ
jgi:hypothetical protein